MNIIIQRSIFLSDRTIGILTIENDTFNCNTLEPTWRSINQNKVFGKTCIPSGTYKIRLQEDKNLEKFFPQLAKSSLFVQIKKILFISINGIPNFEGVYIHPGNYPTDTEGCILPGVLKEKTFDITNSTYNFLQLVNKLYYLPSLKGTTLNNYLIIPERL